MPPKPIALDRYFSYSDNTETVYEIEDSSFWSSLNHWKAKNLVALARAATSSQYRGDDEEAAEALENGLAPFVSLLPCTSLPQSTPSLF